MRAGAPSNKAKDVPFHQALQDPDTRAEYIRRMFAEHCQTHFESLINILQIYKSCSGGQRNLCAP